MNHCYVICGCKNSLLRLKKEDASTANLTEASYRMVEVNSKGVTVVTGPAKTCADYIWQFMEQTDQLTSHMKIVLTHQKRSPSRPRPCKRLYSILLNKSYCKYRQHFGTEAYRYLPPCIFKANRARKAKSRQQRQLLPLALNMLAYSVILIDLVPWGF